MTQTDELLRNNEAYAKNFSRGNLASRPGRRVAIVACMDARLDIQEMLGLKVGDAHIVRNAGGVVTEDVIRSLLVSQRLLGTEEIILIHHTKCGMLTISDEEIKREIQAEIGIRPPFAIEAFVDLEQDVRKSIERIKTCPFLAKKEAVRGFVYDVETGELREVSR
jgi:carbonic anhydrase